MNDTPIESTERFDVIAQREVDAVCDQFEKAWREGSRPDLRVYVRRVRDCVQLAALRELLKLDVVYRRRAGEQPEAAEYREQFPQHPGVVDCFFMQQEPPTARADDYVDGNIPKRLPDFDDFERIEYIGHGGMGVVYRAFDKRLNKAVALKVPLPDLPLLGAHFIREPQNIARLRHPNVVHVHKVGEREGRPFFTMSLIEGPRLEEYLGDHPRDPRIIATLMIKVARAVHHAHQRGILHRDLKPGNVLLDSEREPHVTDFGLATETVLRDASGSAVVASRNTNSLSYQGIVGTIPFMPPEQADPEKEVTTVSDVYGLGAILYAVLTDRPPFRGNNLAETLQQVRSPACTPEPPRALNRRVDRDLEAVCLKCLDKQPARRYRSAEGLARDLERWLDGRQTEARRWGFVERALRTFQRYPIAAALTVSAMALLVATAVTAASVAQQRKEQLEEQTLQSNAYAAYGIASTVHLQLEDWSDPVVGMARDPQLRDLLIAGKQEPLQQYLERRVQQGAKASPFDTWNLDDTKGKLLAAYEPNPTIIGRHYEGRDYFQGAKDHTNGKRTGRASVHISRIFKGENDQRYKFAIAAPVRDSDAPGSSFLGVVGATVASDSTLGLVQMGDEHHQAVLIGQGDTAPARKGADPGAPSGYLILVHPGYEKPGARVVPVPSNRIGEIARRHSGPELQLQVPDPFDPRSATDPNYTDPFDGKRQLAGFAQVGNTDLIIMVQQPYDEAIAPHLRWGVTLVACIGVATFLGLLLTGTIVRAVAGRMTNRADRRDLVLNP